MHDGLIPGAARVLLIFSEEKTGRQGKERTGLEHPHVCVSCRHKPEKGWGPKGEGGERERKSKQSV